MKHYQNLSAVSTHAARAARNWQKWGPFAAYRYAMHRGVPVQLLTLARVLANAEKAGI